MHSLNCWIVTVNCTLYCLSRNFENMFFFAYQNEYLTAQVSSRELHDLSQIESKIVQKTIYKTSIEREKSSWETLTKKPTAINSPWCFVYKQLLNRLMIAFCSRLV